MTKLLAFVGFAVLVLNPFKGAVASEQVYQISHADLSAILQNISPLNLINWKIGDEADYSVSLMGMDGGTMKESVTKEENGAIWIHEEMSIMGQNQVTDELINRADGKVLKIIVNGQEQAVPTDKPEIISQDYTEVTVPAGTFKAIHIVAKTQQVSKMELWANPQATVMDGNLKSIMSTQIGDITLELTSFKHGQ